MSLLVTPTGKPLGLQELRKLVISENMVQGRKVWGIEYHPHISAFEFEEVFMILGESVRAIAENARSIRHDKMINKDVQRKMEVIKTKEEENER